MSTAAVVVMLVAMTLIWGGLIGSVAHALRSSRRRGSAGRRGR